MRKTKIWLILICFVTGLVLFACGKKEEEKEAEKAEVAEKSEEVAKPKEIETPEVSKQEAKETEERKETGEAKVSEGTQQKEKKVETVVTSEELPPEGTEAPDVIMIDNKGYKKDTYGAVKFDHIKHQDEYKNPEGKPIPCTECHHDYQDSKNVWKEGMPVKKCDECHDPNKSDGKKKKLQLAFHDDCKTCHKDAVKAGIVKDAPYKKCADCMGKKK